MAKTYKLNKKDGGQIAKVVLYAGISGAITALMTIIPNIELPAMYAPIVLPIVNVILVAGKKFFENN